MRRPGDAPARPAATARARQDGEILRLALPALGALVAEPLFLLADSAIVGHLGTDPLAGLALASAILQTAIGAFVFLAYATTAASARRLGAGDLPGALAQGLDGAWLATGLGVAVGILGAATAPWLVRGIGGSGAVAEQAVTYLRISLLGLPAMLVVLAVTGVLRGLQDTRTPLAVAILGFGANVALNVTLVWGLHLGIAGSAIGTVIAQLGMAAALVTILVRQASLHRAKMRPDLHGIKASARAGGPLLVRTLALRAALVLTTYVASQRGAAALAAHQVTSTIWTFLAFVLDALAIAGQALTGRALGAGDVDGAREATRRMLWWGVGGGAVLGVVVAGLAGVLPAAFSGVPGVRAAMVGALVVAGLSQPIAGWVFVLDGVLIGAGDGRYLALASAITLAAYLPLALAVLALAPAGAAGLTWLWVAFAVGFMLARAVTLGLRIRGNAWLVTGATR